MIKRILSMLLALALVIFSLLPALAPQAHAEESTEASTTGSGFLIDANDNTLANEYWRNIDIYTLFNSCEEGFLLVSKGTQYLGLSFGDHSNDGILHILGKSISSLGNYTSSSYPLGTIVSGSDLQYYSSFGPGWTFRNYIEAYDYWSTYKYDAYYLTETSYIAFYSAGSSTKNGNVCLINDVGLIQADGTVLSNLSLTISYTDSVVSTPNGLYSEPAPIPADTPVFSQDLSLDPVSYEVGASAESLSVVATVSDGGTLTYQWRGWSDNDTLNGDIVSTESSFIPDTSVPGTYTYNCTVTNTTGTGIDGVATSSTATVIVTAPASTDPDDPDDSGDSGGSGTVGGDSDDDVPILTDIFHALTQGFLDIQSWFTEQTEAITSWGQNIVDAINNWGQQIVDAIGSSMGQALEDAFVPSEDAIQDMATNSEDLLADRFGAVYEGAQMIDQWAGQLTVQTAKPTLTVPAVTVNLAGVPFSFGGWEVDVIPKGFEFLAEICALVIDLVATLAFVNAMRCRLEGVLEG